MSDGLAELKQRREQRAKRTPPDPRHPRPAAVPASGNDGGEQVAETAPPDTAAAVPASRKDAPDAAVSASGNAAETASGTAPVKRARRIGRPPGPERVRLSIRITTDLDGLLTLECGHTGLGPQEITERALADYLAKQERKRERARKSAP